MKDKIKLLQKLHAIQEQVEYLHKGMNVGKGNNAYKGLSEEKVTTAFNYAFNQNRVVCMPVKQERKTDIYNYVEAVTYNGQTTNKHKKSITEQVDVTYRIYCIDTGEFVEFVSSGTGIDTQDKGIGKAMTYAYKNGLLRTFAVATGQDTDKVHSDDIEEPKSEPKPKFTKKNWEVLKKDLEAGKPIDGLNVWLEGFTIAEVNRKQIIELNSELLK